MPNDADAQEETHINASAGSLSTGSTNSSHPLGDDDVTILTGTNAEELPQGLSPRELSHVLKGQLLGHFHLQEFIGGGGMGVVFKALDTTLDRIVAVKVVASNSISGDDLQRRFLIEAQSTARLDHPNIARIHFVGRDRGLPYIVFEYIDGDNLRDIVVKHGPLPLGDAITYTCQIAHALAHAWQKEVVHRDIKPSNILISREGKAKLVDMGLARFYQQGHGEDDLTNTGVTLGTFDYISPEQARDPRDADTRSDIYSLGCTLFYILTARPPFADANPVQKLLKHQNQAPPTLSQLRPEIPESVSQLVSSMLEKSPELRPQLPGEVAASCYQIIQELGLQTPSALTPLPPQAPQATINAAWRTHLPWAIPLTVLIALFGVWTLNANDSSEVIPFPLNKQTVSPVLQEPVVQEPISQEIAEKEKSDSAESTTPPGQIETKDTTRLQAEAPDKVSVNAEQLDPTKLESSESSMRDFVLNWNFAPGSSRSPGQSSLFEITEDVPLIGDSPEKPLAEDVLIDSTLPLDE